MQAGAIDWGSVGQWAAVLVGVAISIASYLRAGAREDAKTVTDLTTRVQAVEFQLRGVPTTEAVHHLAIAIEALGGDVKALTQRVTGLDDIVERVDRVVTRQEDYLRGNK
ncbi:Protein of unknown function [Tistlia consotensis]|uniref:Uncharacterized protein n=1 Tax=Tistlia consotensis USBA 355 TaxID=560819 RepID=A0A1Y6CYD8_9PROT|nr:DUF2730 family protein [Tistlia consotensis]SMF82977.1 Protein of unknown function [Tistlia consotensis USBA 355]SNS31625.1 Protein of unknown function [Tistlia consotensis]